MRGRGFFLTLTDRISLAGNSDLLGTRQYNGAHYQ